MWAKSDKLIQVHFDQAEYDLRCEWGPAGVARAWPLSDAVVIVDILSFSTAVDIAVSNGGIRASVPVEG